MATRKKRKPAKKKRSGGTIKTQRRPAIPFNLGRFLWSVALAALFLVSLGVAGYVIFFRVVVVAAQPGENEQRILFEEPGEAFPQISGKNVGKGIRVGQPKVAIIIDDMGYHEDVGRQLLALDMNLSFSFLPHAPFTHEFEEEAYQRGRTVLLHLPLEPRNNEWDPGPGALLLGESPDEHQRTFEADLQMVPHATGVNNHMGSRYTENKKSMRELLDMLAVRELFFVDSFTSAASRGLETARERGVPAAKRHVFLDNVQNSEDICVQLDLLVELAERRGSAIGIGHPYPETLTAFKKCGADLMKSVVLVGAEELVK